MFKKKESNFSQIPVTVKDDEKQEVVSEVPEYTSQAFSMVRHPDNNGFALVTVAFNPVTMEAVVTEVKKVGENREDAEFAFKVRVGDFFANQESRS